VPPFDRDELDEMVRRWLQANRDCEAIGDWRPLAELYTEDATYGWNFGPSEDFMAVGRDEIRCRQVRCTWLQDNRQYAGFVFTRRFSNKLFNPVSDADDGRFRGNNSEFVATWLSAHHGGGENQCRVRGRIGQERLFDLARAVQESGKIDTRQTARNQPECGERRVTTADQGVRAEHSVTRLAGV
jgi:hypothetical protein